MKMQLLKSLLGSVVIGLGLGLTGCSSTDENPQQSEEITPTGESGDEGDMAAEPPEEGADGPMDETSPAPEEATAADTGGEFEDVAPAPELTESAPPPETSAETTANETAADASEEAEETDLAEETKPMAVPAPESTLF